MIALLLACTSEPADTGTTSGTLPPCDDTCLEHEFGAVEIDAYSEVDGICLSWTLDNDEPIWVNRVTAQNDGFFHHSNWVWVPDSLYDLPDGAWDCWENDFSEFTAAIAGGVVFAQSTQALEETQQFQPGAAYEIREDARIIAYSHLLNAYDEPATTNLRVQLGVLEPDEVTTELTALRLNYGDLQIPPKAISEHSGVCDLRSEAEALDRDFRFELHYVLPHYHTLGRDFRLEKAGGAADGELLFELGEKYAEPFGHTFDTPVSFDDADGLRFTCEHDNPTGSTVGFGIGDQEMCVMLGFADSDVGYDGSVGHTDRKALGEDGVYRHTGACGVAAMPL